MKKVSRKNKLAGLARSDLKALLVSVITSQKEELEKLRGRAWIPRQQEAAFSATIESPLVKVVLGPRRAGKSMLCVRALKEIDHAYLNFDDDLLNDFADSLLLMEALKEVYPSSNTILFDEIQNFAAWEKFISKLQRAGFNLILSGSNAQLLSGELATALTGRHSTLTLLPLSLNEFANAKHKEISSKLLAEYLACGGYPEPLLFSLDTKNYLQTLFESILYKDIVKRHRIRNPKLISNLAYFLANNIAGKVGVERLGQTLGIGSTATTQRLLGYLGQVYLFFLLTTYSHKTREQIRAPRKIYIIDPGLSTALARTTTENFGRNFENLVFLELIRRGSSPNTTLYYYQTSNGGEIDFLIKTGHRVSALIQVCYTIADPGTREREIRSLVDGARELNCDQLTIVTYGDPNEVINEGGFTITVQSFISWSQS